MDSTDSSNLPSPDDARDDAPEFRFQDNHHNQFVLEKLNTLRKNRQFCDLVLQVSP
jgi:hypothetical protein